MRVVKDFFNRKRKLRTGNHISSTTSSRSPAGGAFTVGLRSNRGQCIRVLLFAAAVILPAVSAFAAPYPDLECLSCHSANIKSKKLNRTVYRVDTVLLSRSPHKKLKCVDCHSTSALAMKPKKHMTANQPVDCGECHYKGNKNGAPNLDIARQYENSFHGRLRLLQHNPDVPLCRDCHGTHDILPRKDPQSPVHHLRIQHTCGRCHGDQAMMRKYKITPDIYLRYRHSVHGKGLLEKGLNVTAICTDCHGIHDIRDPADPASRMNRRNIPEICGKCHEGILSVYIKSIHGRDWVKGDPNVPVCTDCHGEHNIAAPDTMSAMVNPSNIGNTCSRCHESKPIADKYKLPSDRLASFKGSYHGIALQLNDLVAANCASCHGSHEILPSSDPRSSINPRNLSRTCSHCHPEAFKNKNIGKVHVTPSPTGARLLYYVKLVYILLISGSVGGFIFYIATDLFGAWRRRRAARRIKR